MRAGRALVAAAVVAAVAGGGAVAAAPGRSVCGAAVASAGNGWLALHPSFPRGPAAVTQAVSVPYVPDRIFATNGDVVMRTDDGGCHWLTALDPATFATTLAVPVPAAGSVPVPAPPLVLGTSHVTSIAAPSSATTSSYVYVGVTAGPPALARPTMFVSRDTGIAWSQVSTQRSGLPMFGSVREIAASPTVPTTAYAVVDGEAGSNGAVYATVDGGATWRRGYPVSNSTRLDRLRVDPIVSNELYALGATGLQVSDDGGSSFRPGTRPGRDITDFDVVTGPGGTELVQGHAQSPRFDRSVDGGAQWRSVRAPVDPMRIAAAPIVGDVAVGDRRSLWVEPGFACTKALRVTPDVGVPADLTFSAPLGNGIALAGTVAGTVVRTVLSAVGCPVVVQNGLVPTTLLRQVLPHHFPSLLVPVRTAVRLAAGAHRDITYHLVLPRSPSPIDVMFLVDTTASTDPTLAAMRRDIAKIVDDLGALGLDVRFGLGDFKDYPPDAGGGEGAGTAGDYPYRLDRRIGLADASLAAALARLRASGGGDPPEAQLTALYQSTTGAGQWAGHHRLVRPGMQAGYRPGSLRLAVVATDAAYHRESTYLTPTWAATVHALLAAHVHQLGLAIPTFGGEDWSFQGYDSLSNERAMAVATGTIAPAGGVDCNGDLVTDVPAGAPLVCALPYHRAAGLTVGGRTIRAASVTLDVTSAIVMAAASAPDLRTVGLRFTGAPAGVARVVSPAVLPTVDLKHDNLLEFTVRYACPALPTPRVYRVGVDADAGSRLLTSGATVLACAAAPTAHPAPPPAAAIVAAPVAAGAAPAPPGNAGPNGNPNPNPALNPNIGFVHQHEEQQQLAFAEAEQGVDEQPELAMSRMSRGDGDMAPWFVGSAALLCSCAAAWAVRTRTALASQRR